LTEPLEVEVKLGVGRPATVRRLILDPDPARLAGFEPAGDAHLVRVTDRYIDTAPQGGRLFLAGMRARVRREGAAITLTVKRSGVETRGVTSRVEINGPATRSLDPWSWPESRARALVVEAAGDQPLAVIATLRQHRLTRRLARGGTTVELSLDRLEAISDGLVAARRHELEAELLEGDEITLAELGESLMELDGVGAPLSSKLQFALDGATAR
jgi:inorganic triphosphatase YgiF